MPSPPIQVFLTTIASQPALRQRQEYILRILQAKRIPYKSYDLASDEEAKRLWRRKAPADKQQLPGILVGGKCPGSFTDFEEAVEFDELAIFLRLNDPYDPAVEEDRPILEEKPIGVPGAQSPSQMAKLHHKASWNSPGTSSPSPLAGQRAPTGTHLLPGGPADPEMQKVVAQLRQRNDEEFDVGEELVGFGLQGIKVTEDDLLQLVADLGLEGDDAGDLVKGLSASGPKEEPKVAKKEELSVEKKEESKVEKKTEPKVEKMVPKVNKEEEPKIGEPKSKFGAEGDEKEVEKQVEKAGKEVEEKAVEKKVQEVKRDVETEVSQEAVVKPEEGTPQEVENAADANEVPTETGKKDLKDPSPEREQKIPEKPSVTLEQVILDIDQEIPTLVEPKEDKKAIPEPVKELGAVKDVPNKSEAKEVSKEVPGEQATKEIAKKVPGKNETMEVPNEAQKKDVAKEATTTPRKSEAKESAKVTVISRKSEAKEGTRETPRQSVTREVTKELPRPNVAKELPKELPTQSAGKESVPEIPRKSVAREIPREPPRKSEAKEATRETPRKSMIPRKVSTPKLEVPRKNEAKETPKATSTVKPLKFRKSEAGKRATNIPPTPERRPRAALEMERPDLNL